MMNPVKAPDEILPILRSLPFMEGLSERAVADFQASLTRRTIQRGTTIIVEGDPPDRLYIVLSGRIKVFKQSPAGKTIALAYFTAGETVGEVAVLENIPYPASAAAAVTSEVFSISRADFLAFVTKHPPAAMSLLNIIGARLRLTQERLRGFTGERAEQRLANALIVLVEKMGPDLPFSRQDIADLAGTTLETSIRILSRLTKNGIIRSSRGRVIVVDPHRVKLISQAPLPFPLI